jgi:hypothetical protein
VLRSLCRRSHSQTQFFSLLVTFFCEQRPDRERSAFPLGSKTFGLPGRLSPISRKMDRIHHEIDIIEGGISTKLPHGSTRFVSLEGPVLPLAAPHCDVKSAVTADFLPSGFHISQNRGCRRAAVDKASEIVVRIYRAIMKARSSDLSECRTTMPAMLSSRGFKPAHGAFLVANGGMSFMNRIEKVGRHWPHFSAP